MRHRSQHIQLIALGSVILTGCGPNCQMIVTSIKPTTNASKTGETKIVNTGLIPISVGEVGMAMGLIITAK